MRDLGGHSYSIDEIPKVVKVGRYASIAAGVEFLIDGTHLAETNHQCVFTINWDQPSKPDCITIGNDVWIGRGAKIFDGVSIGDGAIVGAYTVVAKDVPAFAVVIGNPQRVRRMRFTLQQIHQLIALRWWDKDDEWVMENKELMKDVTKFLAKYAN